MGVGRAFIKRRMADEGALCWEVTGHYYFRGFFSADSGVSSWS
jgi:hypothetical protein